MVQNKLQRQGWCFDNIRNMLGTILPSHLVAVILWPYMSVFLYLFSKDNIGPYRSFALDCLRTDHFAGSTMLSNTSCANPSIDIPVRSSNLVHTSLLCSSLISYYTAFLSPNQIGDRHAAECLARLPIWHWCMIWVQILKISIAKFGHTPRYPLYSVVDIGHQLPAFKVITSPLYHWSDYTWLAALYTEEQMILTDFKYKPSTSNNFFCFWPSSNGFLRKRHSLVHSFSTLILDYLFFFS